MTEPDRAALDWLVREVLAHEARVAAGRVHTKAAPETMRAKIARRCDLGRPTPLHELLPFVSQLLGRFGAQSAHPRYFGHYHPKAGRASVLGDALASLHNPQLAVWAHAPGACELEALTLDAFAERLGLGGRGAHACFTGGGAEANASGLAVALVARYPELGDRGLVGLGARPRVYLSAAGHGSVEKAAALSGLGRRAVTRVPTDGADRMDPAALRDAIRRDREAGEEPAVVVATAGTTTAGAIDPLEELGELCATEGLWLHVDAAYGGAFALAPALRGALAGIERADSVTVDAHKGLGVAVGAGMFFCRHPEVVRATFRVEADYVPPPRDDVDDPYRTTAQWSRRFVGLKVFLTLAERGLPGWGETLERQAALADHLRASLREAGFVVANHTPLPVVCFTHPALADDDRAPARLADAVLRSGEALITAARLGPRPVLRACLTHEETTPADLATLTRTLTAHLPGTGS